MGFSGQPFPDVVRTIIMTGVHGFIGNRILAHALSHLPPEIQFVGSDLSETFSRPTAQRLQGQSRYLFVEFEDLLARMAAKTLKADLVIHNGACSSTTETDPRVFERLNLGYTERLWELCAAQGIPLIYASSASVYGDGSLGFDDHPSLTPKLKALNLYGQSKLGFDQFAQNSVSAPPIWFGLRYFNVYGYDESHKGGQASMAFHGFHQIQKTGKVRLFKGDLSSGGSYGDGCQQRDFVYVGDVVTKTWNLARQMFGTPREELLAKLKTMDSQGACRNTQGAVLNFGTGRARTWNDLARAIFAALGREPAIEYIDMPDALRAHYQNFTEAQHTMLPLLGLDNAWTPLEEGVADYVKSALARGA